ncbi:MAG: RDD family protein [Actinobacteria bacterium]|nr:RDD family protein [Actinomycetota bacterium]
MLDSLLVEAAVPELVYASWLRRILSGLIDSAALWFVTTPFSGTARSHLFTKGAEASGNDLRTVLVVHVLAVVIYMTAFHAWRGSTPGKMAARTVLVCDDGSRVSPPVAFVRAVTLAGIQFASAFLIAPMIVNELRPLWTPRRQTWHDAVARTVVVTAESLPPQNLTV